MGRFRLQRWLLSLSLLPVSLAMAQAAEPPPPDPADVASRIKGLGGLVEYDGVPGGLVLGISLADCAITDGDLRQLRALPNLKELFLTRTNVTDAGIEELSGLQRLETLVLDGTKVTDAGMANLQDMKQLRFLWLQNTAITDAGLAPISKLTELQCLFFLVQPHHRCRPEVRDAPYQPEIPLSRCNQGHRRRHGTSHVPD